VKFSSAAGPKSAGTADGDIYTEVRPVGRPRPPRTRDSTDVLPSSSVTAVTSVTCVDVSSTTTLSVDGRAGAGSKWTGQIGRIGDRRSRSDRPLDRHIRRQTTIRRIDQGVQRMIETVRRRWAYSVWPIAQQTAAAVTAWVIAARLVGHPEPFFAPIAAIVGLNVTLGRRGSNAVRLLIGVVVGIAVAELVVESAGGGVWTLALATFFAMLIARAVDDQPIVVEQAAVSAVLITTFGSQGQGWERLVDALIGVGVALVFSQLLFVPEPLRLLRRAESAVLSSLADGLWLTADALEHKNHHLADQATGQLRALRDNLGHSQHGTHGQRTDRAAFPDLADAGCAGGARTAACRSAGPARRQWSHARSQRHGDHRSGAFHTSAGITTSSNRPR
jgi:Fusaric acid resistance protein-like